MENLGNNEARDTSSVTVQAEGDMDYRTFLAMVEADVAAGGIVRAYN